MRRPLQILKLNDEFGHYLLLIKCRACSRQRVAEPSSLAPIVGWECALEHLSRRLRCSNCGVRDCELSVQPTGHVRRPPWH